MIRHQTENEFDYFYDYSIPQVSQACGCSFVPAESLRLDYLPPSMLRRHPALREEYTPGWLHWRIDYLSHRHSRGLTRIIGNNFEAGLNVCDEQIWRCIPGEARLILFSQAIDFITNLFPSIGSIYVAIAGPTVVVWLERLF